MAEMSANEVAMRPPETGTMPGEVPAAMSAKMAAAKVAAAVAAAKMATTKMAAAAMASTTMASTAVAAAACGECCAGRERQAAAERENCGQRKD
jgi:hypothetical protein